MAAGISGDFGKLDALIGRLRRTAREVHQAAAEAAAPVVERQIAQAFSSATSPDGEPWAALRDGSGRKPLQGLAGDYVVYAFRGQVRVIFGKRYARFHQSGTRKMVARRFLPKGAARLPEGWRVGIRQSIVDRVRRLMTGGAL